MTESVSSSASAGRGAETRLRLIRAGLTLFGQNDFDNVTTRQLADAAGVALSAIPYHFGSKENVYRAVAAHIVEGIADTVGDTLADLDGLLETAGPDREALFDGLRRLLAAFAREILGGDDAAVRAGFILREQLAPSAAFDILYTGLMERLHRTLTVLAARILENDPDSPAMVIRAHRMLGQIMGFRVAREVLLRRLDVASIDTDTISETVAEQVVHSLRLEATYQRGRP